MLLSMPRGLILAEHILVICGSFGMVRCELALVALQGHFALGPQRGGGYDPGDPPRLAVVRTKGKKSSPGTNAELSTATLLRGATARGACKTASVAVAAASTTNTCALRMETQAIA